jgi:LmbE family N-acetylglucosaminyl deacetylase
MTYTKFDIDNVLNSWGSEVSNPAVFVFAHQDDETLTFGAEIEYHKAHGRYCIGVLATDGRSSGVRTALGLSIEDFVKARNLELVNAATELGLDEVHLSGAHDGSLNQVTADALAAYWVRLYPLGSFKVPDPLDDHPDHRALGVAFKKLKTGTPTLDIRFYVKPEQRSQYAGLRFTRGGVATVAAANAYKYIDVPNGSYGIGYGSVPVDFDSIIDNPISYFYL